VLFLYSFLRVVVYASVEQTNGFKRARLFCTGVWATRTFVDDSANKLTGIFCI
jgi:hypothetical protein